MMKSENFCPESVLPSKVLSFDNKTKKAIFFWFFPQFTLPLHPQNGKYNYK